MLYYVILYRIILYYIILYYIISYRWPAAPAAPRGRRPGAGRGRRPAPRGVCIKLCMPSISLKDYFRQTLDFFKRRLRKKPSMSLNDMSMLNLHNLDQGQGVVVAQRLVQWVLNKNNHNIIFMD